MLNSEKNENYTLRIRISQEYSFLINIMLFDANNRIVECPYSNKYEFSYTLPRGIFTIRIEMNGDIKEEVILLDKSCEYIIGYVNDLTSQNIKLVTPPKQFSSALLGQAYGSSHEYYTSKAVFWSKNKTFQFNQVEKTSSLFIFLRFPSKERFENYRNTFSKSFYSEFELLDENGKVLVDFESKKGIIVNNEHGWIAFNAKLPNGIYYLLFKGPEPRQIPIFLYKNWHTQFFLTLGDQPLFGTLRIFIAKKREFNPNDKTYKYIDILLSKLQNQNFILDNELIEQAASGKYQSPMLGLICAYIYLQGKETKSDSLFNIIVQNLQNVILKNNEESADLIALNILATNHFKKYKYKKSRIKGTPMLRIGFETILKASVKTKSLIPQNSINDFISENLFYDSPFNTFKPIPFKTQKSHIGCELKISQNHYIKNPSKDDLINFMSDTCPQDLEYGYKFQFLPKVDKFKTSIKNLYSESLINYIQNSYHDDSSWIKTSIADLIKSDSEISITDISTNLNISGNTVTRIFNDWKKEEKKKLEK